jgi:hypothetical protein
VAAWLDGSDVEEDSLQLGDELGSGGQGRVLRVLGQPEPLVFKQYKITGADPAALRNLVELPLTLREAELEHLLRVTSWPLARVMRQGQVRGFLMQAIPDHFFGPNAAGTLKLRELQFLLYPPKPMWGDIIPADLSAQTRVEVATEFTRLMRLLHDRALVFGDVSMTNVLWAAGSPAQIFVIDCDGIRKLGARPVLKQPDTQDWDDPLQPPSGPDLDTDRYKLALLIGRVLSGKAYIRPGGGELDLVDGVPASIADRMRPLWSQATAPWGSRPDASQWLTALSGRVDIPLAPLGPVRQRPTISTVELEGSGSRPVIQVKPGTAPASNPGSTTRP